MAVQLTLEEITHARIYLARYQNQLEVLQKHPQLLVGNQKRLEQKINALKEIL